MSANQKVNIVVPGDDPVRMAGSPELERLKPYGDIVLYNDRPAKSQEKVRRAMDADLLINSRGVVTWGESEFSKLPRLKMITTCSIGTDSIDLEAAKARGIIICNQPGRTAPVVAEHMFGLMFAVAKRTAYYTNKMRKGQWSRMNNIMLQDKILGIVGVGSTGAEMARLGQAIGMKVIAWTYNPTPERAVKLGIEFVKMDQLLRHSDVVSLHVKLTEDSRGLISARELDLMKPQAILLNGARGPILDTEALVEALNDGRLAGAGIDVFDPEPIPPDHPLLRCEQVVLTPHCADMTPEGDQLLNSKAVDNVIAYLEGHIQNRVI